MRKLVVLFALVLLFASCTKDIIMPSINRTDKPAKEMWQDARDYATFSSVYIEAEDISAVLYVGKYCTSDYEFTDYNGITRRQTEFSDFFRLPAKKFFGIYKNVPTISVSTEYYLISANDLSYAKDIVERKGAAMCNIQFFTVPIDTRWNSISEPK